MAAIAVGAGITGFLIEKNVLGTSATSFSDPGAALRNHVGVDLYGADNGTVQNNLVGFAKRIGIWVTNGSDFNVIDNNEIRDSGADVTNGDGMSVSGSSSDNTITGNLITGASSQGIVVASQNNDFIDNTVTGNGVGSPTAVTESAGIVVRSSATGNNLELNLIQANYGAGIQVNDGATGTVITQNSIADNGTIARAQHGHVTGQIGIDLNVSGDDSDLGDPNFFSINSQADTLPDFPILDSAIISAVT